MKEIQVCDVTMKQALGTKAFSLSFKEKLELAKLLDRLGVSAIEVEGIEKPKVDSLRIKSLASLIKNSVLAVPVSLDDESIQTTWKALKDAAKPRLQVEVAVSPANMEYIYHKKADGMIVSVVEAITACSALCDDVEFIADDATRADEAYLRRILAEAVRAGAKTVTIADAAGKMLPEEFAAFVAGVRADVPELADVTVGISVSNDMYMADASAIAAIIGGVDAVKATSYPMSVVSLDKIAKIIEEKGDACQATTTVRTTEIRRAVSQIAAICEKEGSRFAAAAAPVDETITLSANDDQDAVAAQAAKLGYDLSEEDAVSVYKAFQEIAANKQTINSRELDTIIAAVAMQVPPTYKVESYVINSGNRIKATASIVLSKNGEQLSTVCAGDGPIDASFMAVDQLVGRSYDLEDFQLRSITEGQEAVGEALIKVMFNGKIYSGRGVSTDIVASSIYAYVNTINKIVYEEQF